MTVIKVLLLERLAFLMTSCICKAALLPINPFSSPYISPRMANVPKMNPNKLMMMISNGTKEKKA